MRNVVANNVDFGGGPISGVGVRTAYSAKFDSSGAHLWSQTHSGTESSNGLAIRFDNNDDLVLAGTRDSAAFVTKLDGAGNVLADNTFGTIAWIHGIDIDANGRIVLTGRFVDSVDFGGGTLFPDSTDAMFLASLFVGLPLPLSPTSVAILVLLAGIMTVIGYRLASRPRSA